MDKILALFLAKRIRRHYLTSIFYRSVCFIFSFPQKSWERTEISPQLSIRSLNNRDRGMLTYKSIINIGMYSDMLTYMFMESIGEEQENIYKWIYLSKCFAWIGKCSQRNLSCKHLNIYLEIFEYMYRKLIARLKNGMYKYIYLDLCSRILRNTNKFKNLLENIGY